MHYFAEQHTIFDNIINDGTQRGIVNDTEWHNDSNCVSVCVCGGKRVLNWIFRFDCMKNRIFSHQQLPAPRGILKQIEWTQKNSQSISFRSRYFFYIPFACSDIRWIHFCMANSWLLEILTLCAIYHGYQRIDFALQSNCCGSIYLLTKLSVFSR